MIRSWNDSKKDIFQKINEIMYTSLTLAFSIYYPIIIYTFGSGYSGFFLNSAIEDFILLGNVFIVGVLMGILLWALSAKVKTIKNPDLLQTQNNYEVFKKNFLEQYSLKNKIRRKIYHTIPFAVVGALVIFFYLFKSYLGDLWINYALFFVVILGSDFALTFIIADLVRLLDFSYMPPKAANLFKEAMTDKEINTFTSTSIMVFGFGPFILFDFPIFLTVLLIAAVADAFASLIGLKFSDKEHFFPNNSKKTIEGYFGGFISTFLCVFFSVFFSWFFGLSTWPLHLTLIIAIILSIVFLSVDLFTTKIKLQDNYLNSLASGFTLIIILTIAGVPIF
ncbi:MAG: hypothetical protein GF317_14940 [Candidatus Lokiarchaeota archaeon]|nr:hypothetical protein [Candidatus Lokiarchaeota archaeon]MBD3200888.1 hypothetical protein [Candidatus Lokiarchaeota archaeon]